MMGYQCRHQYRPTWSTRLDSVGHQLVVLVEQRQRFVGLVVGIVVVGVVGIVVLGFVDIVVVVVLGIVVVGMVVVVVDHSLGLEWTRNRW